MELNQQYWLNDIKKHVENRQKYRITRFHKKSVTFLLSGMVVFFLSITGMFIWSHWLLKIFLAIGFVTMFVGGEAGALVLKNSSKNKQDELAEAMKDQPHLIPILAPAAKDIQDNALLLTWYKELEQKIRSLDLSVRQERGLSKEFGEFFEGVRDDHILVTVDEEVLESVKPSVLSSWKI